MPFQSNPDLLELLCVSYCGKKNSKPEMHCTSEQSLQPSCTRDIQNWNRDFHKKVNVTGYGHGTPAALIITMGVYVLFSQYYTKKSLK